LEKYLPKVILILFPFYPLWGWVYISLTGKNINEHINLLWIPIVLFYLLTKNNKLPKYLFLLVVFTIYHIFSVYLNDLVPENSNLLFFILSDPNIYACAVCFVIENTEFDESFISKMNKSILFVVFISLIVSLIQILDPLFFFNIDADKDMEYVGANRNFSIYSWINLNSLGITFPILISILVSVIDKEKIKFSFVVLGGIVVAFLTRARYVMISTIIAFSQIVFTSAITLKKKLYFGIVLLLGVMLLLIVADNFGFSIQEVIDDRILEKNSETEMGSAMARVTSYHVFLLKFPEHPLFGVGPKTRDDVVQLLGGEAPVIHVGYLSYLYFYGLFGFLLLFFTLFFLIKNAWIIGKVYGFWGSFYGIITFCFANTTMVYFNFSEMGVFLAIVYLRFYNQETSKQMINNSTSSISTILLL
jgi:hypothetical protein